jgi:hypothetical protein
MLGVRAEPFILLSVVAGIAGMMLVAWLLAAL